MPVVSKRVGSYGYEPTDELPHNESEAPHRIEFDQKLPAHVGEMDKKTPIPRQSTFGSEQDVGIEEKLRRDENKIEVNIRRKLRHVYNQSPPPYYRLAPERSAPGTAQNDTSSPKASFDATTQYLQIPQVKASMDEVGQRIRLGNVC